MISRPDSLVAMIDQIKGYGFDEHGIATSINSKTEFIKKILEDPAYKPDWELGNDIRDLHSIICIGVSKWGRMIEEMIKGGESYKSIGEKTGVDETTIWKYHNDRTRRPRWSYGEALRKSYEEFRQNKR